MAGDKKNKPIVGGVMSLDPKIKKIIEDQLGVESDKVKPEASFIDDLGQIA